MARLSAADRALWHGYLRDAGIAPRAHQTIDPPPGTDAARTEPPPPAGAAGQGRPPPRFRKAGLDWLEIGHPPPGLDRATWQRLSEGRIAVNRRLDLHGKTATAAHQCVTEAVRTAFHHQQRCIEVITGLGNGTGGVLRRELPLWLNRPDLRPMILAASHVHPRNHGAVLLLLKRVRA